MVPVKVSSLQTVVSLSEVDEASATAFNSWDFSRFFSTFDTISSRKSLKKKPNK